MDFGGYRKTYILFLAGVYPEDIPDDEEVLTGVGEQIDFSKLQAEESEQEEIDDLSQADGDEIPDSELITSPEVKDDDVVARPNPNKPSSYDEIPKYFLDKKTWIKSTNVLCCGCGNEIEGMPCFIPLTLTKKIFTNDIADSQVYLNADQDEASEISDSAILSGSQLREERVIQVHLLTCNSLCSKYYIRNVKDSKITNVWESVKLLNVVHEKLYGEKATEIPEAEDPRIMAKFCGRGGCTEDEYREKNRNKAAKFKMALYRENA